MKRENLFKAERLIRMLEHLEKVQKAIDASKRDSYLGYTAVSVKLIDDLEYMFPDNVQFSMFHNILKDSVESEIEIINKQLEEL